MKFPTLRALVYLRSISRSIERLVKAAEIIAAVEGDEWKRKYDRPKPKPVEIESLDINEAEKQWKKRMEAELRES